MTALENVTIEGIRADYLKKRITITLSVSILQMDSDTRGELVDIAENSKLISLEVDRMPEPQGKLAL